MPALEIPGYDVEAGVDGSPRSWRARRRADGRTVLLRLVAAPAEPTARDELRRTMARVGGLAHDSLLPMQTVITTDAGLVVVYDYAPGGPLTTVLAVRQRLSVGEVVTLGTGLAQALASVHEAGLSSGDVQESSVYLGLDGTPMLADVGLSAGDSEQDVRALVALCRRALGGGRRLGIGPAAAVAADLAAAEKRPHLAAADFHALLRAAAPAVPIRLAPPAPPGGDAEPADLEPADLEPADLDPVDFEPAGSEPEVATTPVAGETLPRHGINAPADGPEQDAPRAGASLETPRVPDVPRTSAESLRRRVAAPPPPSWRRILAGISEATARRTDAAKPGRTDAVKPGRTDAAKPGRTDVAKPGRIGDAATRLPIRQGMLAALAVAAALSGAVALGMHWAKVASPPSATALPGPPSAPTSSTTPAPRPATMAPKQSTVDIRSGPPGASASTGPVPRTAPVASWRPVLAELDRRRAAAFAATDAAALDTVDAPSSPALRADRATVAALRQRGVSPRGLRWEIRSVAVDSAGPPGVVLRVTDRMSAHQLFDPQGELLSSRAARADTAWRVTLLPGKQGWRIADITAI